MHHNTPQPQKGANKISEMRKMSEQTTKNAQGTFYTTPPPFLEMGNGQYPFQAKPFPERLPALPLLSGSPRAHDHSLSKAC